MTIERARIVVRAKPWGVSNLRPWSEAKHGCDLIGEVSYERADVLAPPTSLLLKLLFTGAPLSIQVHPDDSFARSLGLPNGKSEAWYVLDAAPGAKVALGLCKRLTRNELRQAIDDGSIEQLVAWQEVKADDAFSIPAGTIHAIGSSMVLAEIQQRSDTTFRLFDHGRERALHKSDGAAAAHLGLAAPQVRPKELSKERLLLASNAHFAFERIVLAPGASWQLEADLETWLMVINGAVVADSISLARGDAIFAQGKSVHLQSGDASASCLVAYTGIDGSNPRLLDRIETRSKAKPPYIRSARGPIQAIGVRQ